MSHTDPNRPQRRKAEDARWENACRWAQVIAAVIAAASFVAIVFMGAGTAAPSASTSVSRAMPGATHNGR